MAAAVGFDLLGPPSPGSSHNGGCQAHPHVPGRVTGWRQERWNAVDPAAGPRHKPAPGRIDVDSGACCDVPPDPYAEPILWRGWVDSDRERHPSPRSVRRGDLRTVSEVAGSQRHGLLRFRLAT